MLSDLFLPSWYKQPERVLICSFHSSLQLNEHANLQKRGESENDRTIYESKITSVNQCHGNAQKRHINIPSKYYSLYKKI